MFLADSMELLGDGTGHRGFGFVTFSQNADALDAIDNMHLNEMNGKVCTANSSPLDQSCHAFSFDLKKAKTDDH